MKTKLKTKLTSLLCALSVFVGVCPKTTVFAEQSDKTLVAQTEGLQLWLDADSLDLNDGDKVLAWQNQVTPTLDGVTSATQTDISHAPTFRSSGSINGRSSIRMNADTYMSLSTSNGFYLHDMTMFVVLNSDYASGHHELLSRLSGSPFNHNWFFNIEDGFPCEDLYFKGIKIFRRKGNSNITLGEFGLSGKDNQPATLDDLSKAMPGYVYTVNGKTKYYSLDKKWYNFKQVEGSNYEAGIIDAVVSGNVNYVGEILVSTMIGG